ncbi:MAG: sigma-70 family RNA polymerase sigma factor [Desulfobacterales bacterium]|nr:sigma-70 family RNA polymerase sigma factor [Desulfobacterales bacterium]
MKQKNEDAFRQFIRKYQSMVFRMAYTVTLDRTESEDIVQEVFVKVFENIHKFREDSDISTWLYRITINHCLNWKRKWKRRFQWFHRPVEEGKDTTDSEMCSEDDIPERLYEKKEGEALIWKAIHRLPEDARTVLLLKEIEGFSYEAIADMLHIKRGTVSSRLFYARKRLQSDLQDYFDERRDNS